MGGLFQELMHSRPEPLYVDSTEHPEKYEEGTKELLRDLISSRRPPTPEERKVLDAAVIHYSSPPIPKPAPAAAPSKQPVRPKLMDFKSPDFVTQVAAEAPAEEAGIPMSQPKAFWWL
jgi:hypothetical protein